MVDAIAGEPQSEQVAVEGRAPFGAGIGDGAVVDPEDGLPRLALMPAVVSFAIGELQELQAVALRVMELVGLNPGRGFVPRGQGLRGR